MSLHIIFGPMFSGKSTELSRLAQRSLSVTDNKSSIILINSYLDTRSSESCIRTHTGVTIPAIKKKNLMDIVDTCVENSLDLSDSSNESEKIYSVYNQATDIYIDEAQFFDDLYTFVDYALKDGKRIIVAGLDSDCHQKPFGQILSIIPLADSVEKKTALCSICALLGSGYKEAPFTIKLDSARVEESTLAAESADKQETVIDIGAQDKYTSVCRKHLK
mgnify:CR=1 FL=1